VLAPLCFLDWLEVCARKAMHDGKNRSSVIRSRYCVDQRAVAIGAEIKPSTATTP